MITRFNQTANGPLHLGHLYSLLVNERIAHQSGGKFIVRFDDTSSTTQKLHPDKVRSLALIQKETIEWLGVQVDEWLWQSELRKDIFRMDVYKNWLQSGLKDMDTVRLPLSIRMAGTQWNPYPYQVYQTFERVVMDNMSSVTHVIRGEEFLTEFSLYLYYCDLCNFPHPEFIFLPRLKYSGKDISKTNGGHTIAEYRASAYGPEEIIAIVEKAVLEWPPNGWQLWNLKREPEL